MAEILRSLASTDHEIANDQQRAGRRPTTSPSATYCEQDDDRLRHPMTNRDQDNGQLQHSRRRTASSAVTDSTTPDDQLRQPRG
jgi:hypothetical protein